MAVRSSTWTKFLAEIKNAKNELEFETNMECFFRGHINAGHKLVPGLFRAPDTKHKEIPHELWETESDMFFEFKAKAKAVHNGDLSDWDILFYMQHHGVKTRLLDWTENLGVALYFALIGRRNKPFSFSPTIWMLNPYKLNEHYHETRDLFAPEYIADYAENGEELLYTDYLNGEYELWWDAPLAIYPIRRVERLTTQGGYFTIQGTDVRALEDIVPEKKKIWKKIEVPLSAVPEALEFLDHAGINEFTLFPELDGLARYLNAKYFSASLD